MRRLLALTCILVSSVSQAAEVTTLRIVYLDPVHRQTSVFRVEGWPSFLFLPGAPVLVNYKPPGNGGGVMVLSGGGDIDCANVLGPVYVGSDDPNRLDGDGDGIGCE